MLNLMMYLKNLSALNQNKKLNINFNKENFQLKVLKL